MARRTARNFGSTAADHLVVGLGNPGAEYDGTRHNVGFETIDELARRLRCSLKRLKRTRALVAECRDGRDFNVLAKPQTFMNLSGEAVAALVDRFDVTDPTRIIVVQDELDLTLGQLRVKKGGGLAGHNGLRSIEAHLHTRDFVRVRIGVDKPFESSRGADHVLRRVRGQTRRTLDQAVRVAADAVQVIISDGVDEAMNRFNDTDLASDQP